MERLIHRISHRVGRHLERTGLLVRDMENSYLTLQAQDGSAMDDLIGHSITYRVALGPHQGRKAFTLQTLAPRSEAPENDRLAKAAGFSLHGGVAAAAHLREKLERLCRHIARPAVANERLSLTRQGYIRYRLKSPYRDGTTDIETCPHCGGRVKIVASIEDPDAIRLMLEHLDRSARQQPLARAPPKGELPGFKD